MQAYEWQFDGLVGPTHHYAGLAFGNLASEKNSGAVSNPRKAALQGLAKMAFVRGLGLRQAFFMPHYRPMISVLQQLGFGGGTTKVLEDTHRQAPHLLSSIFSSSFMWTANAATIAPSADTKDKKMHATVANLCSHFHRSIEPGFTQQQMRSIFHNNERGMVHCALPATGRFSDEGAANHMRIAQAHGNPGLHVFVYGSEQSSVVEGPKKFPARQTREACDAVARLHGIEDCSIFVQQSPEAIDAGVFHNDVIAMNTTRLMIAHEKAFVEKSKLLEKIAAKGQGIDFAYVEVREDELSLPEAVKSYFFNSQVLERPDGSIVIVAPSECEESDQARRVLAQLSGGNGPVAAVHYLDVRESMRNGGGPACLRLRVVLTEEESAAMHQGIVFTPERERQLVAWVEKHYRDRLQFDDLRDPTFVAELQEAYAALDTITGLGLYTPYLV